MKEVRSLNQRFTQVVNSLPTSQEEATRAFEELAEIGYFLALIGGAMEIELEEEGPVKQGDQCLFGSALGLELLAALYPGAQNRRRTEREAVALYEALLMYYPDSEWANEARSSIGELT